VNCRKAALKNTRSAAKLESSRAEDEIPETPAIPPGVCGTGAGSGPEGEAVPAAESTPYPKIGSQCAVNTTGASKFRMKSTERTETEIVPAIS